MIEYLYNAIIATAGEDITITAKIEDDSGHAVEACHLSLYDEQDNQLIKVDGVALDDVFNFTIPADATADIKGRYWYCICGHDNSSYCFNQPIYLK